MPPPPLPVSPNLTTVLKAAEALYKLLPKDSRRTLLEALLAAVEGKPSQAARLLKLNAETRAIILAGGGKLGG